MRTSRAINKYITSIGIDFVGHPQTGGGLINFFLQLNRGFTVNY
jgi:hypothetical protein